MQCLWHLPAKLSQIRLGFFGPDHGGLSSRYWASCFTPCENLETRLLCGHRLAWIAVNNVVNDCFPELRSGDCEPAGVPVLGSWPL